ncbi:MAG: hypothetical protein JXL20_06070, partial [Deltaproteobacteria bacterium]|nr:hypothetical protein [Deltaproteobacteria bacterium]
NPEPKTTRKGTMNVLENPKSFKQVRGFFSNPLEADWIPCQDAEPNESTLNSRANLRTIDSSHSPPPHRPVVTHVLCLLAPILGFLLEGKWSQRDQPLNGLIG